MSSASYYQANKERIREKHREYARANSKKNSARACAWAKANRERHNAKARAWRQANPGKNYASHAAWGKANPDKAAALAAKYRAAQLLATPAWANKFFIAEAYHLAKLRERVCGGKWHVDHIVPLKSRIVCGLHVEHNLQVIPGAANSAKGNRHWPDMPVSCSSLTYTALSA
jgi:hypothetical protein